MIRPEPSRQQTWALDAAGDLDLTQVSLFLDVDGTLAPIMPNPEDVGPIPQRTTLLRTLQSRLDGRLAVVSGRAIVDIDRILEASVTAVSGVHGLQRRDAQGGLSQAQAHPGLAPAAEALRQFAAPLQGVAIEDKGLSLAVHFRAHPQAAQLIEAQALSLAATHGLSVQPGDCVVELRTPGHDKGDAVRAFMSEAPFNGARPVFVGDDLTDEAGFGVAASLGGYGVLVGPERPTLARRRLADPAAVLAWLSRAVLTASAS